MSRRFLKAILIATVVCMLSVMLIVIASGNAKNDDSKINQLIQMSKAGKSVDEIIETARENGFVIHTSIDEVPVLSNSEIWDNFIADCNAGISGSVKIARLWGYTYEERNVAIDNVVFENGKYSYTHYELVTGRTGKAYEYGPYSQLVGVKDEERNVMTYILTDRDDIDTHEDFMHIMNSDDFATVQLFMFYSCE